MCVLQEEEDDTASVATSIDELTSGAALLRVVSLYLPLPSCRDQHQATISRAARGLTAEPANTKTTVRREDRSNRVGNRQIAGRVR